MGRIIRIWLNLLGFIWFMAFSRENKDEFIRKQLAAVEALSDPEKLKRAALEAPEFRIRIAAIKKIDDPEILKTAALTDAWWFARKKAIEKLNDPETLKFVALNEKIWHLRIAAIEKIDDPEVLQTVALRDEHEKVRLAAIEKISDPETLEALASHYIQLLKGGTAPYAVQPLRIIYAKSISRTLKKKIEESQGHYDTSAHVDYCDYEWNTYVNCMVGESYVLEITKKIYRNK